jgi:uncharacterized membrane protein
LSPDTNIKQKLFFAIIYNGLGIPVAAGTLCIFGGIFMWLIWLLIGGAIIYFIFSRIGGANKKDNSAPQNYLDILKNRYASGEISKEEFDRLKKSSKAKQCIDPGNGFMEKS